MSNDIVRATMPPSVAASQLGRGCASGPAQRAARFAWDEFFYAEHHNPHTLKAHMRAVRLFLRRAEGTGGRAAGHHAEDGRAVPGRPGWFTCQAKPAPLGVTRFLRPDGEAARSIAQPDRVGERRQGNGG